MINKIKNKIEMFRYGFHSTFLDKYSNEIQNMVNNDKEYKEIYEVYHDKFVIGNGARYAALFIAKRDDLYVPVVVKESKMKRMSENLNLFTNLHELGHFKYHIDKTTGKELPDLGRDLFVENDADAYAAQQIGLNKAVDALQELMQTDIVKTNEYMKSNIKMRIGLMTGKLSRSLLDSMFDNGSSLD